MRRRKLICSFFAVALFSAATGVGWASEPSRIQLSDDRLLPESVTSSEDGTIFVGSIAKAAVYRIPAGEDSAEPWITSGEAGLLGVFGVLADNESNTLWVCSSPFGPPSEGTSAASSLFAFDLASGDFKQRYPLPDQGAMCNDIAVGSDGTVYATDTMNMQVVRLRPGGNELEIWTAPGIFGAPGSVLDGIAVIDRRVIVNTLATSKLFSVEIEPDGTAGASKEIVLSRPILRPDGMRRFGTSGVVVAEGGANRLSTVSLNDSVGIVKTVAEGFSEGPVAVTIVGDKAYVLEGQFSALQTAEGDKVRPTYLVGVALASNMSEN